MRGSILVSEAIERGYGAALERVAPGAPRLVLAASPDAEALAQVEVVYFSGDLFPEKMRPLLLALKSIPSLGWLHTFSAGVDNVFFQRLLDRGARISTSSGAQAVPIAQTVMLYLLALSRDLPGWLDDQARRHWNARQIVDLQGKVLGVVGLGEIGLEVARLGAAFRMEVIGMRRTPRGDEPCETWTLDRFDELLARVDCLVLALPLTDETRQILDAAGIARMKPEALVVNIGRGGLIDQEALTRALEQGRLGGAGLDVFEVEPLPAESRLWSLPNVIVTPHSSGTSPGNLVRATEIFVENLGRYFRGEPLRNEVLRDPPLSG